MKTIKLLTIAVLALLSSSVYAQKFAVVDFNGIVSKMAERDSVRSKLQTLESQLMADLNSMAEEYQKKVQEYQTQRETLSPTMRQQKEKELQSLQQNAEGYQQTMQQELQNKQAELLDPIYKELMEKIATIGKSGAYLMVVDKAMPYYMNEASITDVTSQVTSALGL